MKVIIGEGITNSSFLTAIKIKNQYIYPLFNQENLVGDIALLQLEKSASNDTQILRIPNQEQDLTKKECIIKGYGYFRPGMIFHYLPLVLFSTKCFAFL